MKNLEIEGKNILLVDYSNLVARTFWAFDTMTSDGIASGLFYGTLKILIKKINEYNIDRVFICMDRKPYWRSTVLPEYKQGRAGLAATMGDNYESYIEQINDLDTALNHLGFDMFAYKGCEADDIIAAATYKLKEDNKIFIYSSDHDFLQLVDKNVCLVKPKQKSNDIIYNDSNFEELMKMTPREYLDVLVLAGDKSDAIPSIFGIRSTNDEGETIWVNPPRLFSENKAIKLLTGSNTVESLLEGKVNPVKGIGQKTYDLFLNSDKDDMKEAFKRNKKLINLMNGNKKLEGISHLKNQFELKEYKKSAIIHLFEKYECDTLTLKTAWPYYGSTSKTATTEQPKINTNAFASLLNRRKNR